MRMVTALGLVLATTATSAKGQEPRDCRFVRDLNSGPFCFAAAFAVHLDRMAHAYRDQQDSMDAVVQKGAPDQLYRQMARTIAYWVLEKKRVSEDGCHRLREFDVGADTATAGELVAGLCALVRYSTTHDSIVTASALADLEAMERGSAPAKSLSDDATTSAETQQRGERLSRLAGLTSILLTHLLVHRFHAGCDATRPARSQRQGLQLLVPVPTFSSQYPGRPLNSAAKGFLWFVKRVSAL